MSALGRIYNSHKGHVEIFDWNLPDGRRFTLEVRTRRGSTFSSPLIRARLYDAQMMQVDRFEGRADALNAWLHPHQLTL